MKPLFISLGFLLALSFAGSALAQDDNLLAEPEKPSDESADADFLAGEEKPEIEAPEVEKNVGRHEDPGTPLYSLGIRTRWIMIPEWLINAFGVDTTHPPNNDGSSLPLISNVGIGPEFTYRKDGLDITAAIWYAGLGWDDPISFKESGKNGNSWEVVTNELHAILISVDFIWSTAITDWFAITYGAGIGLGVPWGEIVRTEGTQASDGTLPCPNEENSGDAWCQSGEQYGEVWDKLKVIPWINFLAGARFKPHRHFVIYVDGGFGIGFQAGLRAGYIF